jgi:hypothetical protein
VIAVIQATEDDTELRIDFDGDGTFDAFNTENGYRTPRADPVDASVLTLQRGETYVLDRDSDGLGGLLAQDAIILGSRPRRREARAARAGAGWRRRGRGADPGAGMPGTAPGTAP